MNSKSTVSNVDDEFLYSRYLGTMMLDTLTEKHVEDATISIENEISTLNKRLDQSKLLLEETNNDIKEINFLCDHASMLKSQEELLEQALKNEQEVGQSMNLQALRNTLLFSGNSLKTKNVVLDENLSHISLEGVNKLNEALNKLNSGLRDLGSSYKSLLEDTNEIKKSAVTSERLIEELEDLSIQNKIEQHNLEKVVITEQSIALNADK